MDARTIKTVIGQRFHLAVSDRRLFGPDSVSVPDFVRSRYGSRIGGLDGMAPPRSGHGFRMNRGPSKSPWELHSLAGILCHYAVPNVPINRLVYT